MAFDGTVSCFIPDVPFQFNEEWRLRKAQFGDGYQQRTLDGINALDMSWSLKWDNRKSSVITSMLNYLIDKKAASFTFKDPTTGTSYSVFCDDWAVSWNIRRRGGYYYGTMTAQFVKANGALV